ncbi:MAG: ATP-dependent zinc metalloprotease FtsH [Saprospiraceae bacterium]|nr:ATP-dependent zinc metalloprotease FtsH [Saprospiraceae bacterium]
MENNELDNKPRNDSNNSGFGSYWIYIAIVAVLIGVNTYTWNSFDNEKLGLSTLFDMIKNNDVKKMVFVSNESLEVFVKEGKETTYKLKPSKVPTRANAIMEVPKEEFNKYLDNFYKANPTIQPIYPEYSIGKHDFIQSILSWLVLFGLIALSWIFIMRRVGGGPGGPGGQIFNIGRSKAQLFDSKDGKVNINFGDVAGLDEAKEEVMEVVDFLKNPKKYTALGGKIPKGVLLVGPPGTGKTLLAKAVAGEANVPFFSISGSDFVEMFVGVGASRVRDLFRQAREKAPCIVFIDEIDAIGRARGRGAMQGGNDERENTLNQLLVEMDGFSTDKGVILMAATNRSDVLDSALMRPGRFDRQIGIDLPDLKGREQIFNVHVKMIKTTENVDPAQLAELTPGFAGADIANVCNEAALIAARRNKAGVEMDDFNYALDKVIGGLEKKSKIIAPEEKKIIAYHEAGHAICGWYLENAMPLLKVTIVPRGIGTLGYAQYLPKDEYITRTEALLDRMCMTMGGRAAEKIIFGKISTGAQSDLDQVTRMAYAMVAVYGMNDKVGNVSYYGMSNDSFNRPYSDETASLMDKEVRKLADAQYERAQALLSERRVELETLAHQLLEKEVLLKSDVERLIGARPFTIQPTHEMMMGEPVLPTIS